LHPSATIAAVVVPYELAHTILFASSELAVVAAAVWPLVNTLPVL
jgi:hypothetical protein